MHSYSKILRLFVLLMPTFALIACGGENNSPTDLIIDDKGCANLTGLRYIREGTLPAQQSEQIEFLGEDSIYIAGGHVLTGGGWFEGICSNGQFQVNIHQEPFLIWSEDLFQTILFAPVGDKENFIKYESAAALSDLTRP